MELYRQTKLKENKQMHLNSNRFEFFWNLYHSETRMKKAAPKQACKKIFNRLISKQVDKALNHVKKCSIKRLTCLEYLKLIETF